MNFQPIYIRFFFSQRRLTRSKNFLEHFFIFSEEIPKEYVITEEWVGGENHRKHSCNNTLSCSGGIPERFSARMPERNPQAILQEILVTTKKDFSDKGEWAHSVHFMYTNDSYLIWKVISKQEKAIMGRNFLILEEKTWFF